MARDEANHGFLIPSAFYGPSVDRRGVSRNDDPLRSDLAAAEARIRELEQQLDSERRHSSALMSRINELTNPRPTLLEVIDDHD